MLINTLRSHLSEFGVVAAQGPAGVQSAIATLHELQDQWPDLARAALHGMVDQLRDLRLQIQKLEDHIQAWRRKDETSRRLAGGPGVGPTPPAPSLQLCRTLPSFDPAGNLLPG